MRAGSMYRLRRAAVAPLFWWLALLLPSPVLAAGLNVDFGTSWGTPAASYGAASGQTGTWNEVGLGATALVDVTGAASGVSISVSATALGNATSDGSDDARLLADNFYGQNFGWSADLSGLAPGSYRVFLYAPSNGSVPTGAMTVGGTALASLPGDPDSNLVEGTSWDDVVVSTADGTLAISGGGGVFTGLAGLQIVPEPVCNDGIVDALEECEDGNTASGDGCFETCHFEDELVLTGIAAGGSASVSIFGRLLMTSTSAGQSASAVIAALTAEANADAILTGLGVSAVSIGNRLVTNGSIDGADLSDPGLAQCGVSVPASSAPGLALLAVALVAVGSWAALLRRGRA